MIKKDDYIKARKTVADYIKQSATKNPSSTCYIMRNNFNNEVFVTLDKEYAQDLCEHDGYTMMISYIIH